MKIIKLIIEIIILTFFTICAFGGGCLFWSVFAMFFDFAPIVNEIGFYLSSLILAPISWYITPKIADKIL